MSSRSAMKRRVPKKYTEEELQDIETKRLKGELSCAECRRLKLRCDKKVPCGSCVRRGCESICPCGTLSAGQGSRFILASTDRLHSKINEMSHRIRQLEDALAILQATVSDRRHPLLEDELLRIKFGSEVISSATWDSPEADGGGGSGSAAGAAGAGSGGGGSSGGEERGLTPSIDALGTLTLGEEGEVKYFGRSAGSETLMFSEDDSEEEEIEEGDKAYPSIGPMLENLASLFPSSDQSKSITEITGMLKAHLPRRERAEMLCESYLVHASNFFRPMKREELVEVFVPAIYASTVSSVTSHFPPPSGSSSSASTTSPHSLATLYFIFALGALLDLTLPAYNSEAERYYELARAALSLRIVFDSPRVDTVQALGLMATYHTLAGKRYSRDSAWCVMSIAAKLAQCIGLHRDGARWHMDSKTVQKRRMLFWEIYAADMSNSLAIGRPPAIHLSYVDCEFPSDEEATLNDAGEVQHGFWRMKYIFARNMFLGVADTTLTAKSLNYSSVLEVDRKVREFSFPSSVEPYAVKEEVGGEVYHSSSLSLQGFYASQYRTVTMVYLHRSFFAQALLDRPTNPLLSPFAPSFLTAYRCASIIIKASTHQFDRCAEMAKRIWFLLYHTFSAAIIVGTVVTRSPNSNMAASALEDLARAIGLFEQTAPVSHRAKVALGVLRKLQDKALLSYEQYKARGSPQDPERSLSSPGPSLAAASEAGSSPQSSSTDDSDELAIFGGQTRVLAKKKKQKSVGSAGMLMEPMPAPEGVAGRGAGAGAHVSIGDPFSPGAFPGDYAAFGVPTPEAGPSTDQQREIPTGFFSTAGSAGSQQGSPNSDLDAYTNPLPEQVRLDEIFSNLGNANPPMSFPGQSSTDSATPTVSGLPLPESFFRALHASQNLLFPPQPGPLAQARVSQTQFLEPGPGPWRPYSPDMNGLPKADTSFGWMLPVNRQVSSLSGSNSNFFGHDHASGHSNPPRPPPQQQDMDIVMLNLLSGLSSTSPSASHNARISDQLLSPLSSLIQDIGPSESTATNMGLDSEMGSAGAESAGGAAAGGPRAIESDPAAMMVELGLMTESSMDSAWFSFMQDCGIVVPGESNGTGVGEMKFGGVYM